MNELITFKSIIAAILAWVAKIRWSNEYREAKEQTIKAKEAEIETLKTQIEFYKDMTPMKLREYIKSLKDQLEDFREEAENQLIKDKQLKEKELEEQRVKGSMDEIRQLEDELEELQNTKDKIMIDFDPIEKQFIIATPIEYRVPKMYIENMENAARSIELFTKGYSQNPEIVRMSRKLEEWQNAIAEIANRVKPIFDNLGQVAGSLEIRTEEKKDK